ncbi:MAG: hypothetical protein JO171_12980 [Paludibacterium sp.]|uniref:ribonuclease T2 family protein n=1 Tax=Paludibacterium sp. TaxID=1917523 RepID=UPI002600FE20|nr:hypothetical protein [Paludibacterium sp.]MBV8048066.1 hypothetical protein [Paludibacterium sp.]MBV8646949.1 hypothetical protein [Paludibacterium sp.]
MRVSGKKTWRWLWCLAALVVLPAQAGNWILALSWAPGFCATHAEKRQCGDLADPQSFAARHLTLHGLWPEAQNCPATPLRPGDLPAGLERVMPGVRDGLAEHEWRKHGSCSGMQPNAYFRQMMDLADRVNGSSLGRFLSAHAGARVTLDELHAALTPDYADGRRSVRFICGGERLQEIRFYLNDWSSFLGKSGQAGLWRRAQGTDRCDDSVLL